MASQSEQAFQSHLKREYPEVVWYILLSALAVATLLNLATILSRRHKIRKRTNARAGEQTPYSAFTPSHSSDSSSAASASRSSNTSTVADIEATSPTPPQRTIVGRVFSTVLTALRISLVRWEISVPRFPAYSVNVLEALIVAAYTATLLILTFVHTNDLTVRNWSNRAADLAAIQFPLLPALAAKNNIIGWLTGVGNGRLNTLHRMFSRSIFLLIVIHFYGHCRTGLHQYLHEPLVRYGAAAGIAFAIIVVLGARPVRAVSYEFFYWAHVVLVFTFLVLAYLHCAKSGTERYIWPTWIVWGLDRALRALRYFVNNFVLPTPPTSSTKSSLETPSIESSTRPSADTLTPMIRPSSGPGSTPPLSRSFYADSKEVEKRGSRHLARVTILSPTCLHVVLPPTRLHWTPGQHAFLAFPTVSLIPLESHPFTIASIPAEPHRSISFLSARRGQGVRNVPEFVIRVRHGMTKRLFEHVVKHGVAPDLQAHSPTSLTDVGEKLKARAPTALVPAFIDGPYGIGENLAPHEHIVLIAGGTGMSFTLPLFMSVLQKVSAGESLAKRITFVSITRQPQEMQYTARTIRSVIDTPAVQMLLAKGSLSLDVKLYLSSCSDNDRVDPPPGGTVEKPEFGSSSPIQVINARPDVSALLDVEIASARGESMFVAVCGPHCLARAVRRKVSSSPAGPLGVMRGGPVITLHVEHFCM